MSLVSCQNKESVFLESSVDFSFRDKFGSDLLDTINTNYIEYKDISIYYLLNNQKVKQFNENLTFPKMFIVPNEKVTDSITNQSYKFLRLYCSIALDANKHSVTYIDFGNGLEDKVECEFKAYQNTSSLSILRVWYNDSLVIDKNLNTNYKCIKIMK